jgi:phage repressor protein C with HTH and peptisase S24 domain
MKERRPGKDGRIRQADDSLNHVGIQAGDLIIVDLKTLPRQDELCAAFTSAGELFIRYFHRERGGRIRLTTHRGAKSVEVYAPDAVVIFGRVRDTVKTSATR